MAADPGRDAPSVGDVYTPDTLPGSAPPSPNFHPLAALAIDSRRRRATPGAADSTASPFTTSRIPDSRLRFTQNDYDLVQHVPVLREAWVLSFTGASRRRPARTTRRFPSSCCRRWAVDRTCAAFRAGGFAIVTALLLQAEWRVIVNRFLDMAVFYDTGKVAARRDDLNLDGLKSDYGLGFRLPRAAGDAAPRRVRQEQRRPRHRLRHRLPPSETCPNVTSHVVRLCAALSVGVLASVPVSTQAPRFYSDDPIAREPESRDASGAQPWDIGLMYELSYNLFVTSGYKPTNTRAAEHQHDRRGARLELVHEPDRLGADVAPTRSRAGRRSARRPLPSDG